MISASDLRKIGKLKGLANLGHAEKDYMLDILLLSVSRNTKDELVFKGGTCLFKFYKLDRFSEDADFTLQKDLEVGALLKKIMSDFSSYGIESQIKERKAFNTVLAALKLEGPLYTGTQHSICSIRIDINQKSSIDLKPELLSYSSLYPDIPSFSILAMQEKEILAEKVRAVLLRNKARDLYDLWFLLRKGVSFDSELAAVKLMYYKKSWDAKEFRREVESKKNVWETELRPLVAEVPPFSEVRKLVLSHV